MLVADTSALFALFDGDDAHHSKAVAEARRQRPFAVPSEILGETLGLIRHRRGREASRQALAAIRSMPHARITATKPAVVDRAAESAASETRLAYPDWVVVETCRATGATPWTYDGDVRRACR